LICWWIYRMDCSNFVRQSVLSFSAFFSLRYLILFPVRVNKTTVHPTINHGNERSIVSCCGQVSCQFPQLLWPQDQQGQNWLDLCHRKIQGRTCLSLRQLFCSLILSCKQFIVQNLEEGTCHRTWFVSRSYGRFHHVRSRNEVKRNVLASWYKAGFNVLQWVDKPVTLSQSRLQQGLFRRSFRRLVVVFQVWFAMVRFACSCTIHCYPGTCRQTNPYLGEDNWGKFRILLNINSEKNAEFFFLWKKFRVNYSEFFSEFFFRIWLRTTIETGSQEKNSEFFRHL
jgi:hypothetical protein